jgi:hypothetical protein
MPSRDDALFLTRAANDIRSIAKQAPEIADELRDIANDLEAAARRNRMTRRGLDDSRSAQHP